MEKKVTVNGRIRRTRVDIFCLRNGSMLANYNKCGYINLPGGGVDENENLIEAAERELMEESGWMASDYQVLHLNESSVFDASECKWLKSEGFDEEESFIVTCKGVNFKPDERYGTMSDASHFKFMTLKVIEEELIWQLNQFSIENIHSNRAKLRLLGVKCILDSYSEQPHFVKW